MDDDDSVKDILCQGSRNLVLVDCSVLVHGVYDIGMATSILDLLLGGMRGMLFANGYL